jgi:hypothetical protein
LPLESKKMISQDTRLFRFKLPSKVPLDDL